MPITCPHCQNPIYDEEALFCHFCGNSLRRSSQGVFGKMTKLKNSQIFGTLIVLIIIAAFLWLMVF